jgi:hypothetical protein
MQLSAVKQALVPGQHDMATGVIFRQEVTLRALGG